MGNYQPRKGIFKRLLILLAAAVLFSGITGTAFADGTPKISGANIKCTAGETVEFSVSAANNPGIAAYFVYLTSENSNITFGDTASRGNFCDSGTILANTHGNNGVKVSWFDLSNVEKSGVLFTIDVKVAQNTPDGTYPITVKISGENTVDENGDEVAFEAVNGSIKVTGGKATVVPTDNVPADGRAKENQPADKNTVTGEDIKPPDVSESNKQPGTAPDEKQPEENESGKQPAEDGDRYGDTALDADTAIIAKDSSAEDNGVYEVPSEDGGNNAWIIIACAVGAAAVAVLLIVRKKSKKK